MKPIVHVLSIGLIAASLSLIGCADTQVSKIPGRAQEVASGVGDTAYRTSDSGTLYIYDKTWNKMVYTGTVLPDQMVRVEATKDRVTIDGKPVVEQIPLGEGSRYDLYLDTATPVSNTRTIEKRTVIEREIHE